MDTCTQCHHFQQHHASTWCNNHWCWPKLLDTPTNSGQLTHNSHYKKQALRRARQQRLKEHGKDPNPDIGVLQPIPSTECKGLPPATGVTFTLGNTIRRGHGEQLDPTELSPSPFEVPNWDDFGSVEAMQSYGWEGFQEWLQHAVLPGRAHCWKKYTNVATPAMVYYDGSTPLGAVFFVQDHGTGIPARHLPAGMYKSSFRLQLRLDYYGGHFIEASIGMVFQVRFCEHGKVAMGSCSLLPSQLWWDNVLLPLAIVVCIAKSIKLQPPFQWNASTYAVNVQNCFHWKGDANFLVQKT